MPHFQTGCVTFKINMSIFCINTENKVARGYQTDGDQLYATLHSGIKAWQQRSMSNLKTTSKGYKLSPITIRNYLVPCLKSRFSGTAR